MKGVLKGRVLVSSGLCVAWHCCFIHSFEVEVLVVEEVLVSCFQGDVVFSLDDICGIVDFKERSLILGGYRSSEIPVWFLESLVIYFFF